MFTCRMLFWMVSLSVVVSSVTATDYHVYYLGGQSNMDGYGYINKLPKEMTKLQPGVPIFHGNSSADGRSVDGKGVWSTLKPGHGVGFRSDGETNQYSNRFGVELTFAETLQSLFPDRNIAIVKYSRGGTSIAAEAAGGFGCWEPDFKKGNGVNQYDHFLATVRNAFEVGDIDNDGELDRLIPAGIIWMQGESDALYTAEIADSYENNLRRLMKLMRASLRVDDLPIVIGRISDSKKNPPTWKHGEIVRKAQVAFASKDENASVVKATDDYTYSDPWHYDSEGFLDLGRQFAIQISELEKQD